MPRYNSNTTKVDIKHQSINLMSKYRSTFFFSIRPKRSKFQKSHLDVHLSERVIVVHHQVNKISATSMSRQEQVTSQ